MYYAKPVEGYEGSYEYHVRKCIVNFYIEFKKNKKHLNRILNSIGRDLEEFERNAYLAVSMHDIGKLSKLFQEQMKKTMKKENNIQYFRHEILSFVYMIYTTQNYLKKSRRCFPYHYYSVLSHHKRIDINLSEFSRERDSIKKWPELTEDEFKYGLNFVIQFSEKDLDLVENIERFNINKESIYKYYESNLVETSLLKQNLEKPDIRLLYSLCKGLLQYCDWIASSDKEILHQNVTQNELIDKIKLKVESEGKQYVERKFHNDCAIATNDVVAIAPTGSGKTEASLLWAVNSEKSKIIFMMPTMVTSNSIFSRLTKSYFGIDYCGLTHSNSDVYFAINDELKGMDSTKLRLELLQYKAFIPPIMISTVDQLLTSGFNLGFWALKEYALVGSSVIFDEIQAYDTFTLALITETIRKIKKLQGRVMIMSATFPKFLEGHFTDLLDVKSPIVANELMNRRHNKWRFIDKQTEEIIDVIKTYINKCETSQDKSRKVAVIVNNIEKAKCLYNIFNEDYKALCLHSEFAMKDRIEKESLLEGKNDYDVIISTQVIEVSLDISFNYIFSECAPIDNLIQRAGRCNRRGEYQDSEFIVFDYSSISSDYVYKNQIDILKKSKDIVKKNQKPLSEFDISKMVNEVYKDFNMYDENYEKGIELYSKIANEEIIFDLKYDEQKLQTRLIDNAKVSIIPYIFKDIVESLFENKEHSKIPLYEVPVSIGRFKKYILLNFCENMYNLPIYTIDYNDEVGVVYNDETFEIL